MWGGAWDMHWMPDLGGLDVPLYLFMITSFFPVILDKSIGKMISVLLRRLFKKDIPAEGTIRNWVSFKSAVFIMLYYIHYYEEKNTYKPNWLDWLG